VRVVRKSVRHKHVQDDDSRGNGDPDELHVHPS